MRLTLALGWGCALLVLPVPAFAYDGTVLVTRVSGPITPVVADHVSDGVERAERDGHAADLVELDTPEGLDIPMRQARVDPVVLWPAAVLIAIAVVIAGRLAWRARSRQPVSGPEAFTGREVVVRDASGPSGQTWFEGSWWAVRSDVDLSPGERVRVVGADGLTLIVEPIKPERNT